MATGRFTDEAEARRETFRWVAFYNHRRCRHSRAGRLAPITFEEEHHRHNKATDIPATLQGAAA